MRDDHLAHFFADVEISQSGTWFALVSRGGYSATDLCDTVTRWELTEADTSAEPTWTNWTGGDTLWSVAVTPACGLYRRPPPMARQLRLQQRALPRLGPREGIAAVDPADGSVLPWNPGRSRGVGAQELVVTQRGFMSDRTPSG